MAFYTYILASRRNGTLYAGGSDDLAARVLADRQKALGGFTAKYGVDQLVWFETRETREGAVLRERRIKAWKRTWKLKLIEATNPLWRDLYEDMDPLQG